MIYPYVCTDCGHEWEEDQKVSDDKIENCPSCKKKKAKRVIAKSTNFVLKGSCWAKDNYK